jgi:hypothetical protein
MCAILPAGSAGRLVDLTTSFPRLYFGSDSRRNLHHDRP